MIQNPPEGNHPRAWSRFFNPIYLFLGAVLLMLYFAGLGYPPLYEPDEGRYMEIPREMILNHDYVTPHLDGVDYFEKPPLYYWLNVISIKLFGINEFAARFWSALLGLLGLGLAAVLAHTMRSGRSAFLTIIILGSCPLYLFMAHLATIDMVLTFTSTACLLCFWLARCEAEKRRGRARLWWYGMFVAAALSVLTKGLIGMVFPAGIIGIYIVWSGEWRLLRRVPWLTGTLFFLVVAAPWHILMAVRHPDFLHFYFVREHFLRYLTPIENRTQPFWFFIPVIVLGFLPWTGYLAGAGRLLSRSKVRSWGREYPEIVFLFSWIGFIFLFFSASDSKLIPYMLPAFPALAVLAALTIDSGLHAANPFPLSQRVGATVGALLCVVLAAILGWAAMGRIPEFSVRGAFFPLVLGFSIVSVVLLLLSAILSLLPHFKGRTIAFFLASACLFGTIWTAARPVGMERSAKPFVPYLQAHLKPGVGLYSFNYYPQTLPVYLRREINVAAFRGELNFGIKRLPRELRQERFPSGRAFAKRWRKSPRIYLVTDHESLPLLRSLGVSPIYTIKEKRTVILLTNHPPSPGASGDANSTKSARSGS